MNRVAIVLALSCAAAGVAMLWLYKERFEASATGGRKIAVLMAISDVPMGSRVAADQLGIRELPEAYVEDRHVRASEQQGVIGVRVGNHLRAGESILWTDLSTTSAQSRNLAGLVSVGMRAVALPASSSSLLGGLLRPGDRVDAMLTTDSSLTGERMTVTLAQNLLVLAVGSDIGGGEAPAGRTGRAGATVTLAAGIDVAQRLTLALDHGSVNLALRNPDDVRVEDVPNTDTVSMLREARTEARTAQSDALAAIAGTPMPAGPRADEDDDGAEREPPRAARDGDDDRKKRRKRKERSDR